METIYCNQGIVYIIWLLLQSSPDHSGERAVRPKYARIHFDSIVGSSLRSKRKEGVGYIQKEVSKVEDWKPPKNALEHLQPFVARNVMFNGVS